MLPRLATLAQKNRAASFPVLPKSSNGNLELFNRYANQRGISGGSFEVEDALGKIFKGTLDATGRSVVSGATSEPAKLRFGMDSAEARADGSLFGSDGKDYMNTTRDKIQQWKPLLEGAAPWLKENSAIHIYGETRKIKQRYLEGDDAWAIGGKSWHWQPGTADEVFETKGMKP
ncbi:hypothetical protein LL318_07275 [Serratia ureilytica]|nr:hypothetical protein [Serratia ureilytica]